MLNDVKKYTFKKIQTPTSISLRLLSVVSRGVYTNLVMNYLIIGVNAPSTELVGVIVVQQIDEQAVT